MKENNIEEILIENNELKEKIKFLEQQIIKLNNDNNSLIN